MTARFEDFSTRDSLPSASTIPSIYDTYLCMELSSRSPLPEIESEDSYETRLRTLQSSAGYFLKQDRIRAVERLQFETARVFMQEKQWGNALRVMRPLWQTLSWRQAGWWYLVEEVDWALRECARMVGDVDTLIAVEWELLSKLSATFAFGSSKTFVGEKMSSQLVISSRAHKSSMPITLTSIQIAYQGKLKSVKVQHDPEATAEATSQDRLVLLYNSSLRQTTTTIADETAFSKSENNLPTQSLLGLCNLTFAPGITKVVSFDIVPRESGDIEAISVTLCVEEPDFDFEIIIAHSDLLRQEDLWFQSKVGLSRKALGNENSGVVRILPKASKMRIELPSLKSSYFTDELVVLDVHVINEEKTEADVSLEVRLLGNSETIPDISFTLEGTLSEGTTQNVFNQCVRNHPEKHYSVPTGQLAPAEIRKIKISLQAESEEAGYILEIKALYHLLSDLDTIITKTVEVELAFARPFEVNYSLVPRIHHTPWPSYFNMDDNASKEDMGASGLCQNWSLTAKIASFGTEAIIIENVRLRMLSEPDDATYRILPSVGSVLGEAVIMPAELQRRIFDLEVQKYTLEDGHPTALNLQIEIQWRRESPLSSSTTSCIAVPELVIPFGEPRVLAVAKNEQQKNGLIHLDYTIENPSMYVLSFDLSMETSEQFAFSGAKTTSLQLVPLARHTVRYSLLPLVTGGWINPQFRAIDLHFNKRLKIHATEGLRSDAKGTFIWID
ncbi:hypothetical protein MMC29_003938 [Sticta canariensis]|nr:hypothetical protein [Sticta canariensis]